MSVPTDNNKSVKYYDKISRYKDLNIKIEKNVTPYNNLHVSNKRNPNQERNI